MSKSFGSAWEGQIEHFRSMCFSIATAKNKRYSEPQANEIWPLVSHHPWEPKHFDIAKDKLKLTGGSFFPSPEQFVTVCREIFPRVDKPDSCNRIAMDEEAHKIILSEARSMHEWKKENPEEYEKLVAEYNAMFPTGLDYAQKYFKQVSSEGISLVVLATLDLFKRDKKGYLNQAILMTGIGE